MERTIVANFDPRRDAETAVEHLVQEHGIERADIFVRAPGKANTAGVRPAGADVESGHPGVERHGEPELSGPIEVSVECREGQVHLRVVDHGPGVPDYAGERVFERFYSLPRPDSGQRSSGLGLPFVREVATLHGGEVSLRNCEGGGAVATLTLPLA